MPYYIYILQNKTNNKIYVGQTNNPAKRRREHKAKDRFFTKGTPLYNAIKKYGFDSFEMTIIEEFTTPEESDEAEEFWIQFFQSRNMDLGYNIAQGGRVNRNFKHTQQFKEEKSKQMKNYYLTHKPHNFGKETPNEIKQKLSNLWDGEKALTAKFTNEQIKEIRKLYATGNYSQSELARKYEVSSFTMSEIVRYKRYKNT